MAGLLRRGSYRHTGLDSAAPQLRDTAERLSSQALPTA